MLYDYFDYYGSFKVYIEVKKKFFDILFKGVFVFVNIDDKWGLVMVQNIVVKFYIYSLCSMVNYWVWVIYNSLVGLQLELDGQEIFVCMIGYFNVYNLLVVFGIVMLLEVDCDEVFCIISGLQGFVGCVSYVCGNVNGIIGVVDYVYILDLVEKVC